MIVVIDDLLCRSRILPLIRISLLSRSRLRAASCSSVQQDSKRYGQYQTGEKDDFKAALILVAAFFLTSFTLLISSITFSERT